MKKHLTLLLASILPLTLFSWFVPSPVNQIDFMGLWFLAMVILALPMIYTEVALAYRSGMPPMTGLQKLTREADASPMWRGFSWLSKLLIIAVASLLIGKSADILMSLLPEINIPSYALAVGLMVVATISSVWGINIGIAGLVCIITGMVLAIGDTSIALELTSISMLEWGKAVMMSLISVGSGSGLYWFLIANLTPSNNSQNKQVATKSVLPIWLVQTVVGGVVLLILGMKQDPSTLSIAINAVGFICLSTMLLNFASQSLIHHFGSNIMAKLKGILVTLVLGSVMVLIPNSLKEIVLVILTSISVLVLSIFTGWKMKISHLRKSMNFGSELTYNIWRIAVRLVVPIAIVIGLVGWIMSWIGL